MGVVGPLGCVLFLNHTKAPYRLSEHSFFHLSLDSWRIHLGNPGPPFGLYGACYVLRSPESSSSG